MCGIGGIRRFGEEPIRKGTIEMLLCELEGRGNDATGVCIVNGAEAPHVLKLDTPAWNFCRNDKWKDFATEHLKDNTDIVLMHTRKFTKGSPRIPMNNHPVSAGMCSIVHNGTIHNDDELFRELKLVRRAEVDTDIVRAIVDEHGVTPKAVGLLGKMRGSAASAVVDPRMPGSLMIMRSGSPLHTAMVPGGPDNKPCWFVFSSTKEALHKALRPYMVQWGMWFQRSSVQASFGLFPDHSVLILGPDGKAGWHQEFKLNHFYAKPDYSGVNRDYKERIERVEREAPKAEVKGDEGVDMAQCPNDTCGYWCDIPPEHMKTPLWKLACDACGTRLAPRPKGV